jgi:hypothetical protein
MRISGTFVDEISHDIPHQNWGAKEWDADFSNMHALGIDTVIMIRAGYRKFLTYPSPFLIKQQACFSPKMDLVKLFIELAEKYGMTFYFGTYDSGKYWDTGDMNYEVALNIKVIKEAYDRYGKSTAFGGWYLSTELSRKTKGSVEAISRLGRCCKDVSGGLPVLISPWIDGKKAVSAQSSDLTKVHSISAEKHMSEWNEIFDGIKNDIDIVAFQDGHVEYDQLEQYQQINRILAEKHGLISWTNTESFDRDMPIKFLPIKFEKLLLKLEAAEKAQCKKAITFEFSHFMSPQSSYKQAHHLYNRYREYFQL